MKTVRIANYVFDKVAKTITFSDFATIELDRIVSVTNVTRGKQLFFNKFSSSVGTVATNVLTLATDTNSDAYDNADKLTIEYIASYSRRTIISSVTDTVSGNSSDILNIEEAAGGIFYFAVSAVSGTTPEITFKLQAKDHAGNYIDVPSMTTTAIDAIGQRVITLHPAITASANSRVTDALPQKYRIAWTIAGTTPSFTFSVGLDPIQ